MYSAYSGYESRCQVLHQICCLALYSMSPEQSFICPESGNSISLVKTRHSLGNSVELGRYSVPTLSDVHACYVNTTVIKSEIFTRIQRCIIRGTLSPTLSLVYPRNLILTKFFIRISCPGFKSLIVNFAKVISFILYCSSTTTLFMFLS